MSSGEELLTLSRDEFDVREDEEQYAKLQDTVDLLVAAGYFRARLKALPHFDRVVGGMVWCITLCNRSVDVDLFYSENSSIGQKIALTERVVEVLPHLKCPHSIEPHQIQGLDYIHIFPVVQWLVKQAVEAKAKRGDVVQNHAIYQFGRRFRSSVGEPLESQTNTYAKNYANLKAQCSPMRMYKRVDGFVCSDLHEEVRCTLMEYAGLFIVLRFIITNITTVLVFTERIIFEVVIRKVEDVSAKSVCVEKQRISAGALAHIIDARALHQASAHITMEVHDRYTDGDMANSLLVEAEQELMKLRKEKKQIEDELLEADELCSSLQENIRGVERRIATHLDFEQSANKELVKNLTQLTAEHDGMRKREADFKANCKAEMCKMQQQLEVLHARTRAHPIENEDKEHTVARQRLEKVRLQAAAVNRRIAVEQRRLDSMPSQIEINQYQRRIIELYNQMAAKHRETKQFYTLHNTLIDVKTTSKETYKDSFIENLENVLKGVDATLDKVSSKSKELQTMRERISDDYQYLLDKERLYHKTVDDFKKVRCCFFIIGRIGLCCLAANRTRAQGLSHFNFFSRFPISNIGSGIRRTGKGMTDGCHSCSLSSPLRSPAHVSSKPCECWKF
ncbi:unnamed protein product [Toxocara canis]|uniref:Coiled-coil domain-containing protein 93 n=1 Tax=Toxocara canis TaxID=6265 RepID=A0A183UNU8_TOXCA|nr:unnamed protein product [Toxocara canis]